MDEVEYRVLQVDEVDDARKLSRRNPDLFASYALDRLPAFYDIADMAEPASSYAENQRLMVGAFCDREIVGAVFVSQPGLPSASKASMDAWDAVLEHYSEHELNVFSTLSLEMLRAVIDSPYDSLLVHTLCVDHSYRRTGVARKLLSEVIERLTKMEHSMLYIKIARIRHHVRLCEKLGFKVVKQRFSISDRLQFGCWGSTLLRYETA